MLLEIIILTAFIIGWLLPTGLKSTKVDNKDSSNSIVYPLVMWEMFDDKE